MPTPVLQRNLTNTVVQLAGGPSTLYSLTCSNSTSRPVFVQLFNQAAGAVTLGITTPDHQYSIPPLGSVAVPIPAPGILFANGIQVAATLNDAGTIAAPPGVSVYATV